MAADLTGKQLGNYQIIAEIGRGGMGTVYRAFDPRLRREVAIKVLRPVMASGREVVMRFQREAVTMANLKHPNIVIVHDVGTADEYQYIVMELVRGSTIRQEIQEHGALELRRAIHMLTQLASALDYAHQHALVHRDVEPSNVIIGQNDHVTLMDFGLVKALQGQQALTQAGTTTGTLNYMAPEQVTGEPIDHRADIYALGVLIFELLTGRLPFEGTSPHQVIMDIMHSPPPSPLCLNPALDAGVEPILARALAKDRSGRFPTAGKLMQALCRLRASGGLQLVSSGGQRIPLSTAGTSVVRDPDNDLVLREVETSRYRAHIYCEAATWFVVDPGSTNGTCLNEHQLGPHVPYSLEANDALRLGYATAFRTVATDVSSVKATTMTDIRRR